MIGRQTITQQNMLSMQVFTNSESKSKLTYHADDSMLRIPSYTNPVSCKTSERKKKIMTNISNTDLQMISSIYIQGRPIVTLRELTTPVSMPLFVDEMKSVTIGEPQNGEGDFAMESICNIHAIQCTYSNDTQTTSITKKHKQLMKITKSKESAEHGRYLHNFRTFLVSNSFSFDHKNLYLYNYEIWIMAVYLQRLKCQFQEEIKCILIDVLPYKSSDAVSLLNCYCQKLQQRHTN